MAQPQPSLPPPFFCPPFFCHCFFSSFFVSFGYHRKITRRPFRLAEKRKRRRKKVHHSVLVSLRSRFSCGNHGDAYTPDAIPSPTPWDNRSHLSRPHLSAIHFSAIPSFAFFRFFRLSPKNHPSVLSVSRKKEKKTKECYCPILAFGGSDSEPPPC